MASSEPAAPVRHQVTDGAFDRDLIRAAAEQWPRLTHPAWHRYDSALERKWALRSWEAMPEPCRLLLGQMALLRPFDLPGLVPDLSLWGAGLHAMEAWDRLDVHLDADRHPMLGLERRANAILFVGEWADHWGGVTEFWSADLARPLARVTPRPGRLVLFETGDTSYHGVTKLVDCPGSMLRKTLALYWWAAPRGPAKRPRAQFVRVAGEPDDPVKDQLRRERAGRCAC